MNIPIIKRGLGGIYAIRNIINGKIYIGSSKNLRQRLSKHSSSLSLLKHDNEYLQRAYNKYGADNFECIILEIVENEKDLLIKEQYYINFYNAAKREFGYNLITDAVRSTHSLETRQRMSKLMTGKTHSQETKDKISRLNTGKKRTPEQIERLKKNTKKCSWNKEQRKEISLRQMGEKSVHWGKKFSLETRQRMSDGKKEAGLVRPIIRMSLDDKILMRYESIADASRAFGSEGKIIYALKKSTIAFDSKWIFASSKLNESPLNI